MWRTFQSTTRRRALSTDKRAGIRAEPLERRTLFAAGDLDPAFGGGDGIALSGFGGNEVAYDVALLANGKIVVGATGGVVRFNADGSLDRSFGGDGRAETPGTVNGDVTSVAVQADGRVIAGTSGGIYRFNNDGTLDTSFGGGDGVATPGTSGDVVVLPDGRIVTGGALSARGFDANGNLDPNFGRGGSNGPGVVSAGNLAPNGNNSSFGNGAIAVDAEGRIVSAGMVDTTYNFMDGSFAALAVARFTPDGLVDSTFAPGGDNTGPGVIELDSTVGHQQSARDVAIGPDGRIVVLGRDNPESQERYGRDYVRILGASEPVSIDSAAFNQILDGTDYGHLPTSITVGPDGKLLYVGAANAGTEETPRYAFGVARFNRNGSADTTFAGDGVAVTPIGSAASARAAVVQPDGKIVVVGGAAGDIAVVRYLGGITSDGDDQVAEAYRVALPWRPLIGRAIDSPADVDVFRVEVPAAGRRIGFDVDRPTGGALDAFLAVFNAGGARLASNDNGIAPGESAGASAGDPYLEYTFPAAGTYYVAVSSAGNTAYSVNTGAGDAAGSTTGGYSLTLTDRTPRNVGDYDFSFGVDGRGQSLLPSVTGNGEGTIALHPDGTFVAANAVTNIRDPRYDITNDDLSSVRYNADGLVDGSFGPYEQGIGQPVGNTEEYDEWGELAVAQPGGRTVVIGRQRYFLDDDGEEGYSRPIFVVRYGPTGSLDTGADGWAGSAFQLGDSGASDEATAAAVQGDGKILIAGTGAFETDPDFPPVPLRSDFWVARLLPNGSMDTSFGGDGIVIFDFDGHGGTPSAVAALPGGKVLVTGTAGAEDGGDFAAARLNPDGSLDTSFGGGDGRVTTDFNVPGARASGNALALLPGGKFAIAGGIFGDTSTSVALARYNADGSLDTTFGTRGVVVTPSEHGGAGAALGDDAGRILVGTSGQLSRYTAAGAIDRTFGANGFADSPVSGIRQIFPLPGGNWLVSGYGGRARHLGAAGPAEQPSGPVAYEAEAATARVGAVVASNHPGYTGSGFVDFANASGDYVEWTINVPSAGTYALDFRYANGSSAARPLELRVNGVASPTRVAFGPTGSWATWRTATATATLSAGSNTIRITAVGSNGANVDSLTVRPAGTQPQTQTLQAEAATLSGPVVQKTHTGYTGSGYADFGSSAGEFIDWAFDAPSAGEYDLTFRYANGGTSNRPLDLSVNGQRTGSVAFAPTGSWTTWRTVTARVTLAAGRNRVRLTAVGSSGANLDSMSVAPAAT
jgi:uncharacterized delta-60 repeat protein